MPRYIHEQKDWPNFHWNQESLMAALEKVRHKQGELMGLMQALGFSQQNEAVLQALTGDVVKSSEIEGEILNADQVRSSIARRLGLEIGGLLPEDRRVEGVVEMTLEAAQNYAQPMTRERLFGWHRSLFPIAPWNVKVARWRDDEKGPMQVVSGALGREHVHYEAPAAGRLDREMDAFFAWINRTGDIDSILRAAKAHLWFVNIHPFDDGNGRIARAIADWALARAESNSRRCYSMSAQIRRERKAYYAVLESAGKGSLDITDWMLWFLGCLDRAITSAQTGIRAALEKDNFWKTCAHLALNERQRRMLNKLLDGTFQGKLTTTKWALMMKCSHDSAQRDIVDLIDHGIMVKNPGGGRSTSYSVKH